MYVCVSQNTRDSPSWKLSKFSSCESTNVFEKEEKIVSLFFVKAKEKKREKSVEAAADLASSEVRNLAIIKDKVMKMFS